MNEIFRYYNLELDTKRADWLVKRCIGPKWTLHSIIPAGFSGYVRILHPAWSAESLDPDDDKAWNNLRAGWREAEVLTPIRWDLIAAENNHVAHRLMQWFDICSATVREPGMAGVDPPSEGSITAEMVERLFSILIQYGDKTEQVLCGFWEGNASAYLSKETIKFKRHFSDQFYHLLNTTLAEAQDSWLAADEYSYRNHGIGTDGLTPNLLWPATREWCLVVDYNLRSSYFGGPLSLIDSILGTKSFETYEAFSGDEVF